MKTNKNHIATGIDISVLTGFINTTSNKMGIETTDVGIWKGSSSDPTPQSFTLFKQAEQA
jgi:hypothetical protein